jgi:hypothetical protein
MDVFSEIEVTVSKELDKLKEKLEALKAIQELEAEIEKLKSKLEGNGTPADAIATARARVNAVINNSKSQDQQKVSAQQV